MPAGSEVTVSSPGWKGPRGTWAGQLNALLTKIVKSFPTSHSRPGPRPALTGHLESGLIAGAARRGSDSTWGGRQGKMGRGGGAPTSETSDVATPAPCRPTLWPRLPGIPALTPSAPGPAGAPVSSQLSRLPPVSRAPKLPGVRIRHCQNNGDSRRQRGDSSSGDRGGKGRDSSGGGSGGDGVCAG